MGPDGQSILQKYGFLPAPACDGVLFPLRLSLQVAAVATVFALIFGIPCRTCSARKHFRGKEFLDLVLTLPMVLPPVVTGYILLLLIGNNGVLGRAFEAVTGRQLGIVFTWWRGGSRVVRGVVPLPDQDGPRGHGGGRSEPSERVVHPGARRALYRCPCGTAALGRAASWLGRRWRSLGPWASSGPRSWWRGTSRGKTTTMPIAIYSETMGGSWGSAWWMVALFVVVAGVVMYISNRLGRKAVQGLRAARMRRAAGRRVGRDRGAHGARRASSGYPRAADTWAAVFLTAAAYDSICSSLQRSGGATTEREARSSPLLSNTGRRHRRGGLVPLAAVEGDPFDSYLLPSGP